MVAEPRLAALLPIRERVLGADHPDTLTTRHNLAYWTGEAEGMEPDSG
ncbi:tetratricopeptide repeat protein [Nonomuraea thailandensis]